ncbi:MULTISPECIES: RHS repeat domain-containing protein [Mycetohabitans]|uniref:RHS repeat domain-containing protein n=1 Tax=Mycetohabitans TaxID=2571159 RepID=UPI001F453196|nr:RHS repeat-associated core domain-containing protein [Mycetohabitans sp. B3]MCF2134311.1 RHS repeat protein [Mycetohabitans sp. B3]
MNENKWENVCKGTPVIQVIDNRGLGIRTLQYNRDSSTSALDERVSVAQHTERGHPLSMMDARLFDALQQDPAVAPNVRYVNSLSGRTLRRDSVDAGLSVALFDAEGRMVWSQDGRGSRSRQVFDVLGRPVATYVQPSGEAERCHERILYGEHEPQASAYNLKGHVARYYDTAGQVRIAGYTIHGKSLQDTRRLLANRAASANWAGEDEAAWTARLSAEAWTTKRRYGALGEPVTQTDAKGHRHRFHLDLAGRLQASWLKLADARDEQIIVDGIQYTAAGQLLSQTAGNGIVTAYGYEAETQRLLYTRTHKKDGTPLQAQQYTYDPVGNILAIGDDTQPTRYFRNQQVEPLHTYRYDALYQLLEATGRENAPASRQGPGQPVPPRDPINLTNYTRNYTYDRGGNLTTIQHQGQGTNAYRNEVVIATRSNHGVAQTEQNSLRPEDIERGGFFDQGGNCMQLQPGQPLEWNERNQLMQVTMVDRGSDDDNDQETYGYDGNGMRVWKQRRTKTASTWRTEEVIYLPGLELRTTRVGENIEEALEVVTTAEGAVRVLHWSTGQPTQIPNDQYRWSVSNPIGSVNLELDSGARILTREEYYPYGGTAVWGGNDHEVKYKFIRYSGKERDGTGLYYYGYRYYQPWLGRWASADPAGTVDGLNLYSMVRNNPISREDPNGLKASTGRLLKTMAKQHWRKLIPWAGPVILGVAALGGPAVAAGAGAVMAVAGAIYGGYKIYKAVQQFRRGGDSAVARRRNQESLIATASPSQLRLLGQVGRALRWGGLAVAVAGGIAAVAGAAPLVAAGVGLAAAIGGAAFAVWAAPKIARRFASSRSRQIAQDGGTLSSFVGNSAAATFVSAEMHGASHTGAATAVVSTMPISVLGWAEQNPEASVAGAHAGGVAVGEYESISRAVGVETGTDIPALIGTGLGGGIMGYIHGQIEGSTEVGQAAGAVARQWHARLWLGSDLINQFPQALGESMVNSYFPLARAIIESMGFSGAVGSAGIDSRLVSFGVWMFEGRARRIMEYAVGRTAINTAFPAVGATLGVAVTYGSWISFAVAAGGAIFGGYGALSKDSFASGIQRISDWATTQVFSTLELAYPQFSESNA